MKLTVSFDFDGTLAMPHVQEFAKELLDLGIEVRVTTTRYDDMHCHKYGYRWPPVLDDLWEVVDRLQIPRHHVRFTNMEWKSKYLLGTNFVFHLDDNEEEFHHARYDSVKVPMVQVNGGSWKKKCLKLLEKSVNSIKTNESTVQETSA